MISRKQLIVLLVLGLGIQAMIKSFVLPLVAQPAGGTVPPTLAVVLATCATGPSYTAGTYAALTVNVNGQLCVNQ